MTKCQRCKGATPNGFLCRRCADELRATLTELPWWLARLTETAVGQTRIADNGGRRSARRKDLDGDATLASCIETLPDGDDLQKARDARQKAALAHFLATGGVNHHASPTTSPKPSTTTESTADQKPAPKTEATSAASESTASASSSK